jgi:hypothetical protein
VRSEKGIHDSPRNTTMISFFTSQYLANIFNIDVLFELPPPILSSGNLSNHKLLVWWTYLDRYKEYNMMIILNWAMSECGKHNELRKRPNASIWNCAITNLMVVGTTTIQKSTLVCIWYKWCVIHRCLQCQIVLCYIQRN